jgi:putative DNA primase/helicase
MTDHAEAFRRYIEDTVGSDPGPVIDTGGRRPVRFRISGTKSRSSKPGWYTFHGTGVVNGVFADWRTDKRIKWRPGGEPVAVDREQIARERDERRHQTEDAQARAATEANQTWQRATKVNGASHPYLDAKVVGPHGTRQLGDLLLVPMYGPDDTLINLQRIWPDGSRRYLAGARREGAHFVIGDLSAGPIVFAEGFATAASIHQASGYAVVVCFDADSLVTVARWAAHRWAGRQMIVAGDDDWHLVEQGKPNKGREVAMAAARILGSRAIFPRCMA